MFLAHVYLIDEPCFLVDWHKFAFEPVGSLEELNGEVLHGRNLATSNVFYFVTTDASGRTPNDI